MKGTLIVKDAGSNSEDSSSSQNSDTSNSSTSKSSPEFNVKMMISQQGFLILVSSLILFAL